jgi:hypothetical protein
MKKIVKIVVLLAVLAFAVTACVAPAVQTSAAVQIPEALVLAFNALVLAGVTVGLQVVFDSVGLDLRGIGTALAVALSGFVLAQLQGFIDLVPVEYDLYVNIVLNIIVVVLTGLGYLRLLVHPARAAQLLPSKK